MHYSMIIGRTFTRSIALLALCANALAAPDMDGKGTFQSPWLEIKLGTLIGERGGQPKMLLVLAGKQSRGVWVRMTALIPGDEAPCEAFKSVTGPASVEFTCPLAQLVADTPYPIRLAVFSDETARDLLEQTGTVMRFGKKDVAAFLDFMRPPTLPVTFENVTYTNKLGVGTALLSTVKKPGALTVTLQGLTYVNKNTTLEVPASALRKVRIQQVGTGERWVVVEYVGANGPAIAAFQGSAYKGSTRLEDVSNVLSFVLERAG